MQGRAAGDGLHVTPASSTRREDGQGDAHSIADCIADSSSSSSREQPCGAAALQGGRACSSELALTLCTEVQPEQRQKTEPSRQACGLTHCVFFVPHRLQVKRICREECEGRGMQSGRLQKSSHRKCTVNSCFPSRARAPATAPATAAATSTAQPSAGAHQLRAPRVLVIVWHLAAICRCLLCLPPERHDGEAAWAGRRRRLI